MKTAETVDITKLLPSELLRLAVADVRKCWRSPRYYIDMNRWHGVNHRGVCNVCLAGAVMAKELGGEQYETLTPCSYETDVMNLLRGLDCFRAGEVTRGLMDMGVENGKAISVHDSMRGESWFLTFETRTSNSAGLREKNNELGELLKAMTWLARQLKKRGL